MKVKVILIKKINLGDYNAVHLGMEVETEAKAVGAADLIWQQVKESIDAQAEPFLAERLPEPKTITAKEAGVHEPNTWEESEEGEYRVLPADDCWIVHTETQKGQEALKIGPYDGKDSMWGIYVWKDVRMTRPELDDWKDWPMAKSDQNKGFVANKSSIPKGINEVVIRTDGEYPEIVALK